MLKNGPEREVVILMTDMIQYSLISSGMTPVEIRDFLIDYHCRINDLIYREGSLPLEIEPSAGDGSLVIFDKRPGEDCSGVCTRAVEVALRMAEAITDGTLAPTRMGIFLGHIIEAKLGTRMAKFGASFAVANRLEELCGHFGTHLLMDREVARYQKGFETNLVNIGKISLTSVLHPMNIFTIYRPGIQNCPAEVDEAKLLKFIQMKNEAMEHFSGNLLLGVKPDFPMVREKLLAAQKYFTELAGREDVGIERILEYIRETPFPASDFDQRGMKLLEKKRDSLGERLFHLSKELLRAMNSDFYHVLVVDTNWERYFKLEWCNKGDTIIQIDSVPDGIYYLDSGTAEVFNSNGELLSTLEAGTIFGEMAYFGREKKRTASVRAKTDTVLRKISTEDFEKLPVIIKIFKRIAMARRQEIVDRESPATGR
ncbi:MAG: cyclic nucleotide-binding domain-containing protein [Proteobacteria bacterium]|nr:cyclic nucleotide-binding domain-containing protein [Pseudomonadota bacterium]MCG2743178.1 cyclic nucleotide-binding domain-containing protein [Desulfobacteraceae bacterium]MBU4028579.1 cyclic nucleotide-binding domain-containing protein [Pseudomonadota bacterium]MBU4043506.1 cyclic nucleotide-binding domain-containing protein [Pseudomonadota bacterium]MBU4083114.1 cyclic nucleotide-binding domain-containing protein [Pseudomonadota bacterium]